MRNNVNFNSLILETEDCGKLKFGEHNLKILRRLRENRTGKLPTLMSFQAEKRNTGIVNRIES